eukprot:scaffold3626_cov69-Skeletonema_dohrnii-CCMP3373.AAC.9
MVQFEPCFARPWNLFLVEVTTMIHTYATPNFVALDVVDANTYPIKAESLTINCAITLWIGMDFGVRIGCCMDAADI